MQEAPRFINKDRAGKKGVKQLKKEKPTDQLSSCSWRDVRHAECRYETPSAGNGKVEGGGEWSILIAVGQGLPLWFLPLCRREVSPLLLPSALVSTTLQLGDPHCLVSFPLVSVFVS